MSRSPLPPRTPATRESLLSTGGGRVDDLGSGRESEFPHYQTEDGCTRMEVHFKGETARTSLGQTPELLKLDGSPGEARLPARDL